MAALQLREDERTGRLTLRPAVASRVLSLGFGLIWLAVAGVFLLPVLFGGRMDWLAVIAFLFFAFVPVSASLLSAIFTTTVTIDRGTRTLSSVRSLFVIPVSSTVFAFRDLTKIEVQYVAGSSAVDVWLVNAVSRDNRRTRINWNGRQREMMDLAQKISELTGAPVVQAESSLPAALQDMLKKIAPTALDQTEPARRAMPPLPDPYAPPPVAMPRATSPDESALPQEANAPPSVAGDAAPIQGVWNLPVAELERRVANDSMDADARYVLARRFHARGDLDRAIELYRQAVRIDPTNPNAHNDLGVALQARGKRAEAETAYRRAAALDPFSSIVHRNLALLLRSLNRAAEASQEFFLARQNARDVEERNAAEAASTGARMEPRMSANWQS